MLRKRRKMLRMTSWQLKTSIYHHRNFVSFRGTKKDKKSHIYKGHVTRGNLPLQLAIQFVPKKILQVAVRMSVACITDARGLKN